MFSPLLDPASHLLSRLTRFKVHNPWRFHARGILPDGIHVVKGKNGTSPDRHVALAAAMGDPPARGSRQGRDGSWSSAVGAATETKAVNRRTPQGHKRPPAARAAARQGPPAARLCRPSRACGTGSGYECRARSPGLTPGATSMSPAVRRASRPADQLRCATL